MGQPLMQPAMWAPRLTNLQEVEVKVALADSSFHADVFVTGHPAGPACPPVKWRPTLIVEVLSPAIAASDRGDKFAQHRLLDSVREYGVVDLDGPGTYIHRKGPDALWVLHPAAAADTPSPTTE